MTKQNPFSKNPFTTKEKPELLKIPDAPETHEPRKPLRAWLGKPGGGDDGGRPSKPKKIVQTVREVVTLDPGEDVPMPSTKPRRR